MGWFTASNSYISEYISEVKKLKGLPAYEHEEYLWELLGAFLWKQMRLAEFQILCLFAHALAWNTDAEYDCTKLEILNRFLEGFVEERCHETVIFYMGEEWIPPHLNLSTIYFLTD